MQLLEGKSAVVTGAGRGFGRAVAALFVEHGARVVIINVSSTSGMAGDAGQINYAAGKMGVVGMTKTIAKEWGRFNIRCNAVAYGFIETRLTQSKELGDAGPAGVALGIPAAQRDALPTHIPLGRAGTPRDAAGPVLFPASPLSDYVTGAFVPATGGLVM